MSIVTVQPAQAYLPDPSGGKGGWTRGIPTPWDGAAIPTGISAIQGLSSSAANVFGDSPPIDGEIYLVTSFVIAYMTFLPTSAPDPGNDPDTVTELALMVGPDVIYRATDAQPPVDINGTGVNANFLTNGVFSADLVNPIVIQQGDILKIRVGVDSVGDGATIIIGAQGTPEGAGAVAGTPYTSTISYTLMKPAQQ